jgi:hypothetical protein
MHVLPIALIFGFAWATVTTLRVGGAFLLGACRGVTQQLEPAAITSLIVGPPAIANAMVAVAVTALRGPRTPCLGEAAYLMLLPNSLRTAAAELPTLSTARCNTSRDTFRCFVQYWTS